MNGLTIIIDQLELVKLTNRNMGRKDVKYKLADHLFIKYQ